MTLNVPQTLTLLEALQLTQTHELTCDEWLAAVPEFLEASAIERATEVFKMIRQHVNLCQECREELALLIQAMQNLNTEAAAATK